jgi:DNA-binding NtrC family response regulator
VTRRHKTTAEPRRPRPAPARPSPTLRLLHTPESGVAAAAPIRLHLARTLVGREVDAADGVFVDDTRASRVHASVHLVARSGRVRIHDEDSRNGTFVNGERTSEAWLEDGDVVRVADTHLIFRLEPEDAEDAVVGGWIGQAPSIRRLRATAARLGPHDVTVLLIGESGSGKEVLARALHQASGRRGEFVAVNCSAIPEQLAESQLFGHVAGAFTGARGEQPGFFRAADGGTLLLDEIGEMDVSLQPKLLRALEQRAIVPVGAAHPIPCDVRIVAATNRDLLGAVDQGRFRGDLYARLVEFTPLELPPLRARREDILLLLRHAYGEDMPPLEPDLVDALLAHGWPYNVRELLGVGRELRVRGHGQPTLALDLVAHRLQPPARGDHDAARASAEAAALSPSLAGVSDRMAGVVALSASGAGTAPGGPGGARQAPPTRDAFERILQECRGNVRAIARATGRSRMQVYRWLEQFGLDLEQYRDKP